MAEIETSLLSQTYEDVRAHTQGIEVKDFGRRVFESNSPLLSSGRSDFSLEVLVVGQDERAEGFLPFTDKIGVRTAVQLLDARTGYEEIFGYDSGFVNGTIEPLPVRVLSTTNLLGASLAQGVKADCETLSVNSRPSAQIVTLYEVRTVSNPLNAFFDATDAPAGAPVPGFSGISGPDATPFDENRVATSGILQGAFFRHGSEFGSTRRSAGTGFTYHNADYGVDSVAFGGLKR